MIASQFTFRFVRDVDDDSQDDVLKIKKSRSGKSFVLQYNSVDLKNSHEMHFLDVKVLTDYLFSYLSLLKYDDCPFINVQFDPPVFPTVMFTPENLHYNIRRITSLIETHYN